MKLSFNEVGASLRLAPTHSIALPVYSLDSSAASSSAITAAASLAESASPSTVIAAINEQNQICLLKQWRHAIGETIWELPAGCLEPGEPPLETAKRELEEEAGVKAEHWRDLGYICSSPGFSNELLYLFEARGIKKGTIKLDDAEQLEAHWVELDRAHEMCLNGEIIDAKTVATVLKLKV